MDKATNLAVAPDDPPSIEERLAAGSADDVEQALRQIHDECPLERYFQRSSRLAEACFWHASHAKEAIPDDWYTLFGS